MAQGHLGRKDRAGTQTYICLHSSPCPLARVLPRPLSPAPPTPSPGEVREDSFAARTLGGPASPGLHAPRLQPRRLSVCDRIKVPGWVFSNLIIPMAT